MPSHAFAFSTLCIMPAAMRQPAVALAVALAVLAGVATCATTNDVVTTTAEKGRQRSSLYPARPSTQPSAPIADPPLSRPTMHLTLTREGLQALLDTLVPASDTGSYALLGARTWKWERSPFSLAFDDARKAMTATTDVTATVGLPGTSMVVALQVVADVQPVLTSTHALVLQAVAVKVTSTDRRLKVADFAANLMSHVETTLSDKLTSLRVDLRPAFSSLHEKLAAPLFLPLSPASACFTLDLRAIEAGPSVLADGLEKQLALTVAPSLTMPCTVKDERGELVTIDEASTTPRALPPLPSLANASGVEGGPFTLTIPIAAGYDELQKAMNRAFVDGKLFISTEQPALYIANPEVFSSAGDVVVRVQLGGYVEKAGLQIDVDGDLYLAGRPTVRDNFLEFPDLKPTVETDQALLKAALALKGDELVGAVKRALRLDLSARMRSVKQKLIDSLTMRTVVVEGVAPLCTRVDIGRISIDDIAVHDPYLRATVTATAMLSASLPCPGERAAVPAAPVSAVAAP